ncbi:MAG: MFS transporter [Bacteroidota bacterium]
MNQSASDKKHNPFAALGFVEFRYFLLYRFLFTVGIRMQGVIVGWQIYEHTHDPLSLGLIGLAEAIPYVISSFFAGHTADVVNRKVLMNIFTVVFFLCALTLTVFTFNDSSFLLQYGVTPIYTVIFISGIARGFLAPAVSALLAQIIPREHYANSSAWNSNTWQTAAVAGPAIGGLVYGFAGVTVAYLCVCSMIALSFAMTFKIKKHSLPERVKNEPIFESLANGVRFLFSTKSLLAAISLDLFAVLFGGAVSILPIFADDILKVGAEGLGFLNAAPFLGSVIMGIVLAYLPPLKEAGKWLLYCVAGFGVSTILFALSSNFYLSFSFLLIGGMFDCVSVIIRGTLQQLLTPDNMRGRISALNNIFIGSSNELGAFESGAAAKVMGLIPSVIFGGSVSLCVVFFSSLTFPDLRKLNLRELK